AAHVATFFRDLPERIATANLVIARSGASTVAELMAIGRPAILVPLPHALDNDQLENATRLQDGGGGWCIRPEDLTPDRPAHALAPLAGASGGSAHRSGWPRPPLRLKPWPSPTPSRSSPTSPRNSRGRTRNWYRVQRMHLPDPDEAGLFHIVGIGGIGMSAIA